MIELVEQWGGPNDWQEEFQQTELNAIMTLELACIKLSKTNGNIVDKFKLHGYVTGNHNDNKNLKRPIQSKLNKKYDDDIKFYSGHM